MKPALTINGTQNRQCLFGEIVDGEMRVNDAGRMVQSVWEELPQRYHGIDIDALVVMPNHIHGIIMLMDDDVVGAGPRARPGNRKSRPLDGQPRGVAPTMSLPDVVHRFKSLATACYRHGVTEKGWREFCGRLWQRNYYEHIVRGEEELDRIRLYIEDNPLM
ncbi:MAG: transposase [Deltaproteobacteria bacterium]|nr:transposase [Deltaproteobacteria bacterium]